MRKTLIFLALLTSFPIHAAQPVTWLQQYLAIDTINPLGNEFRGVAFLAKILKKADIQFETAESAPGRGNIWARLKGGNQPALILLHHIDVVPADGKYWDVPPLSGEIRDDYIYGRGAIDTKALGIVQLSSFLALRDSGERLNREVIFMSTADQEAGGFYGAGWLLENRPEIFEDVGYLVNECGSAVLLDDITAFNIEVTQKVSL